MWGGVHRSQRCMAPLNWLVPVCPYKKEGAREREREMGLISWGPKVLQLRHGLSKYGLWTLLSCMSSFLSNFSETENTKQRRKKGKLQVLVILATLFHFERGKKLIPIGRIHLWKPDDNKEIKGIQEFIITRPSPYLNDVGHWDRNITSMSSSDVLGGPFCWH